MIDGRLLVPALAVWVGAALSLAWHPGVAVVVAAALAGGAWAGRRARQRGAERRTDAIPSTLSTALAAVCVLVGGLAALLGAWRLSPEPLDRWVGERASAVVVGAIAGEPRLHRPVQEGAWWERESLTLRVVASSISARGAELQVILPIRLRLAPDAEPPPRGTVISVAGRLAEVDAASGLAAELRVSSPSTPPAWRVLHRPGPLDRTAHAMRTALSSSLVGTAGDPAALVQGLTIGDDSAASPELTAAMRASGLAHLVAVSGGNVSIVVGVVVAIATLVRWRLAVRVLLGLAALLYYAFLVGPEPSVLRASVMGSVVLVGVLLGGRRGGPSVLAAGVLGLILLVPSLALSWGFALSAGATAGLILLAPVFRQRLARGHLTARLPAILLDAFALTIAAQLSALPLLVALGGAVGWVSIPANLLAMPAVAPVTVLGLAAAVIGPVAPSIASAASWLAGYPAGWIARVAFTAPELPAAQWPVASLPQGWAGLAILAGVGLAAALVVRVRRSRWWEHQPPAVPRIVASIALTAVVLGILRPPGQRGWPPPDWLMLMCDVGQGDAVLLRAGPESAVVVDTGNDGSRVGACLDEAGISQVPAVVLTHFHADHVGGLGGLLEAVDVGTILSTPLADPREQALLVDEVASDAGHEVLAITAGDRRRVGQVTWQALWPRRIIRAGSVPNNASVVLLATVAGRSILLTGDIEPEAQTALLADVTVAGARGIDVVKVPHHGSVHQSEDFAHAADAPIALISVGADNDYGHPAQETLDLYGSTGALVIRTDLHGDTAIVERDAVMGAVSRSGMLQSP